MGKQAGEAGVLNDLRWSKIWWRYAKFVDVS